jgi:anthranilate/para-aminobenzoate synthase component I
MDPEIEISLERGRLTISGKEKGSYPASQLFPQLRRLHKKYQERGQAPFSRGLAPFPSLAGRQAQEKVPVPFAEKRSQSPSFFTGGFVGYLGYETAPLCDKIKFGRKKELGIPDAYFGFFREVIVYEHAKRVYYLVTNSRKAEKMKSFFGKTVAARQPFRLKKIEPEITRGHFEKMVRRAKEYIAAGDIYQANLSQRFNFGFRGSALALYGRLRSINPSPFSSFFKIRDLQVVSSSPERLIRKKGVFCETRPIAGTCPAYGPKRKLQEWRKRLLQNPKERAEHLMLVDLERNDLGRVCDYRSVRVGEFMTLEKYSHVVHIVSKITGKLQKGKDAFDLIKAMFPGGTITGCPKIRCMEIIDELEPVKRGLYTGSLGYIDRSGDMDLNIVIRTLVLKGGTGHLQVGAGIVWDSDPAKEYEETLHKGEALVEALKEASITNRDGGRRRADGASGFRLPPSTIHHPVSR